MLRLALVLLLALILLGIGVDRAIIASPYSDPESRIRAQDESMYANTAQTFVREGNWITPRVMGRLWLLKPPLLAWLAGVSVKAFGWSLWALRLPSLLAAVVGAVLVYWIAAQARGPIIGFAAALLLLSNSMWHTLARLCYSDTLFAACTIACVAIIHADPGLKRRASIAGFGAVSATAIMDKSVGGFLPLIILVLYWMIAGERRPDIVSVALVFGTTVALAAPWHVYHLIVHREWFWADYVDTQILQFGLNPTIQTTTENSFVFYGRRLFGSDPFLWVLAAIAMPMLIIGWRRGDRKTAALLGAWLFTAIAVVLSYRARNLPYSLNTIPPACVVAAVYCPFPFRGRRFFLAAVCVLLGVKALAPDQIWGLAFGKADPLPSATELQQYAALRRSKRLIIANPDDEFYSATILPRVHYYFVDPRGLVKATIPHYTYLGITATVDEFADQQRFVATYAPRLRRWGLNSTEPLGTAITSPDWDGLGKLMKASPSDDYYVTQNDLRALGSVPATHDAVHVANGRTFLLSHVDGR